MSITETLGGILLIALGCWQFYASAHAFNRVRTSGGPSTSPFMAFALWYGFFFGAILILIGIGAALNKL